MSEPATTALDGPPPTWRPGYDDDTPIYLDVVRAMGIPGQDGPTGGDVVQGEVQPDPPVKHRAYTIDGRDADPADPKTWGMPETEPDAEPALEETPGHYEPHSEYGTGQEDIPPCVAGDCGCTGTGLIGCPGRDGEYDD